MLLAAESLGQLAFSTFTLDVRPCAKALKSMILYNTHDNPEVDFVIILSFINFRTQPQSGSEGGLQDHSLS